MKITVLSDATFSLTPAMLQEIGEAAPGYEVDYYDAGSITARHLIGAEAIFGCPPSGLLRTAAELKWLHLPNAGVGEYADETLYRNRGTVLTNSRGVYGEPVAEHVVAMVFALARCLPLYARQRREKLWRRDDLGCVTVSGSTALIFGAGDLGGTVAKKLKALGMYVIAVRRVPFDKPEGVDEMFTASAAPVLIPRADFVINCLPHTKLTDGIISRELLSLMKPRSFFINVGRGRTVDEPALVELLESGAIAGAALDVTEPEPPAPDSPLWELENVILTPHAACVRDDIQERKLALYLKLLAKYAAGRALFNKVDFRPGY